MTTDERQPLSVAILAGGQSRRMGTDKALLRLEPDGKELIALVIDVVRQLSADVFVVAPDRPGYDRFEVPIRPDLFGDTGALGGVASAIAHAEHGFCLVVSCDSPFLNLALLNFMANKPRSYDVLIPKLSGESRQGGPFTFQTMHAIYAKSCLPAIERTLKIGERRVTSFLNDVRVQTIDEETVLKLDPDLRSFLSVNTPEAFETARNYLRNEPKSDKGPGW